MNDIRSKIRNKGCDIGSLVHIEIFYANKIAYDKNPTRKNKRLLKESFKQAKACLKGEMKRQKISNDEYDEFIKTMLSEETETESDKKGT